MRTVSGQPALGVSIAEAARSLGVSRSTVNRRIADGTIRVGRLGARVIVPRAELERILGLRETGNEEEATRGAA